jgi:hypothetical protein
MTEFTLTLVLLAIAAVYLASYWVRQASQQSARQTQILVAAIADLRAKPLARDEQPADMPWVVWSGLEDHRWEWKREEERVQSAKLHQAVAKQNLEKAKKQTFGRKAAVAQCQAALDALVEKERARLEARKAEQIAEGERVRAEWKAQPYQLWSRANWGDRTWRINGSWRRLAEAVEAMEYFTRGASARGRKSAQTTAPCSTVTTLRRMRSNARQLDGP